MALIGLDRLNALFSNGTTVYVGLLSSLPDENGRGAVELSGGGYARAATSTWLTSTADGITERVNASTIEFGALTADTPTLVGFGIYDASTSGNLLIAAAFKDDDGREMLRAFSAGQRPLFIARDLRVGVATTADWALGPVVETNTWNGLCRAEALSLFFAVAIDGTNRVMTSEDGRSWSAVPALETNSWRSVCWSPSLELLVAVASDGTHQVMTSPDGVTWTGRNAAEANSWRHVTWAEELGLFVAVASSGTNRVMTSPDGVTWTARAAASASTWLHVTWSPEKSLLVAVGTGAIMTSPNGITWTSRTAPGAGVWRETAWSKELSMFVGVGSSDTNRLMTSTNGLTWSGTADADAYYAVVWIRSLRVFLTVGNGVAKYSRDGNSWTALTSPEADTWFRVSWSETENVAVAVAQTGTTRSMRLPVEITDCAEIDGIDEQSLPLLQALLPPGRAWPRDPGTNVAELCRALSYEFSRIKQRCKDLLEELDPRTCTEMIADFERVYGITPPDGATLEDRRVALHGKMLGFVAPSIPNLTAIADRVGYTISIHEYKYTDLFSCISDCTDSLYTYPWLYVWTVTTPSGEADDALEALLQEIAPLHTLLEMNFT